MSNNLIETLEARLNAATNQPDKIDAMNALAWAVRREKPDLAWELSRKAQDLSRDGVFKDNPYVRGIAASLCAQSSLSTLQGHYGQSLEMVLEALSLIEDNKLTALLPQALYQTAVAYSELGQVSEALEYSFRQLQVSKKLEDNKWYARGLVVVGATHAESGNLTQALKYSYESLPIFRELQDSYWTSLVLNNLSDMHYELGNYEDALLAAREGLTVAQEGGHRRTAVFANLQMGHAYVGLGDWGEALSHYQTATRLAKTAGYPDAEIDVLLSVGRLYNQKGQPGEALSHLEAALEIAQRIQHKRFLYRGHRELANSYKLTGQFEQALSHFEQFHAIRESVYNDESEQKVKNLEVMYQTETVQKEAAYYASLYEAEQSQRQLSEILNQVGQALTGTLNLNEVLNQILAQLDKLVSYDRGALLLWNGAELEFVAARGFDENEQPLQYKVPINTADDQDIFVRIYQTKEPVDLPDVSRYPGWKRVGDVPLPGSWLGVPLIRDKQVTGMLSLARTELVPYTGEEIALAKMFAAQAAIALQNAQLYDRVQRFTQQLNYEVRQRTSALQEAYEQLERLDRTKSSFIEVTAHELRTPITVLKGYSQLLARDPVIVANAYHHDLVTGIVSGAGRMHEIVNTMLMMVKLDSRELEIFPEPLNVSQVMERIAAELQEDLKERSQTLIWDESLSTLPAIDGDGDALLTVFTNLVINAIKYTPDGGEVTVSGRSWDESPSDHLPPNSIEVVVSDTGIGIAPQSLDLIFTKFYQTGEVSYHSSGRTKFKGGGPGLGLAIARGIVEAHRGLLWAESEGHNEETYPGSQFYVVLPLQQRRR